MFSTIHLIVGSSRTSLDQVISSLDNLSSLDHLFYFSYVIFICFFSFLFFICFSFVNFYNFCELIFEFLNKFFLSLRSYRTQLSSLVFSVNLDCSSLMSSNDVLDCSSLYLLMFLTVFSDVLMTVLL